MNSRIQDLPVYEKKAAEIDSASYNLARLALKRIENPLRFDLTLRDMSMILEDKDWIVVDAAMNDLPVLAWTDFQTKGRSLHEPVNCTLLLFHAHAGIVLDAALNDMKNYLEFLLHGPITKENKKTD